MAAVDPVFFLDRGLGSRAVPGALRQAGWQLTTMDERYGPDGSQGVADVDWIAEASRRREVMLCKDLALARNPLEAQTVHMCEARVFALSRADRTATQMVRLLLRHQEPIVRMASRAAGPYVVAISERGLRRVRLSLG